MSKSTKEQQLVIDTTKCNLIVSAGAGSGKTSTLTNRVINIIKGGISINNLLVLTFTKAASNEMKTRIRQALSEEESLKDELNYIDSSYITTFDSFSLSIVKKYYYKLGLDKNISITDETLISIIVSKLIRTILDKHYLSKDEEFLNMVNNICVKSDKKIIDIILKINKELDKKVDKNYYIDNYYDLYSNNLELKKKVLDDYVNVIKELVYNYKLALEELLDNSNGKIYDTIEEYLNSINNLSTYEQFNYFFKSDNKLPNYNNKYCEEAYRTIKENANTISKEIIKKLVYDDLNKYDEEVNLMKPYTNVILRLVKELNIELDNYKNKYSLYTFNDISRNAINILMNNEEVRLELQNKFKEIMVDEYQDTSDIQEQLINLIANNNVCVVGDVKQSIYRFRNANPSIFKDKYNSYSKSLTNKKIDLLENFRSREEVVNDVNLIFSECMTDKIGGANYKNEHKMIFGNKQAYNNNKASQDYHMDVLNYNSIYTYNKDNELNYSKDEIEAFVIANDIKQKMQDKYQVFNFKEKTGLRDVKYNDFCILISYKTKFDIYRRVFEYMQIPLNILSDDNLIEGDEVLTLKNILKLILSISNKSFKETNNESKYQYLSIARSFLFCIDDEKCFDIIMNGKIKETEIYSKCYDISLQLKSLSLQEIISLIINSFDFINKFNAKGSINKIIVESEYLISSASSFSSLNYTIEDYITYLDDVINNQLKINFEAGSVSSDSVQIMSIHRSKGLEFQICYYSGLSKKFNKADINSKFLFNDELGMIVPYYKFGLHETFYKELYKYYFNIDEISERIRLFYVAITRAKEKVIIIDNFDINNIKDGYNSIYDLSRVNSFSCLLNGIYGLIINRIKNISFNNIEITKDYLKKQSKDKKIDENIECIKTKSLNINYIEKENINFSKKTDKVFSIEEKEKMEFGEKIHYILECLDFKSKTLFNDIDKLDLDNYYKDKIKNLFNSYIMKNMDKANIYKEYQFNFEGNIGIIDLIMEYDNHIDIIDYKLKNILDEAYKKQLNAYKNVISLKTNKEINIYLYSILSSDILKL